MASDSIQRTKSKNRAWGEESRGFAKFRKGPPRALRTWRELDGDVEMNRFCRRENGRGGLFGRSLGLFVKLQDIFRRLLFFVMLARVPIRRAIHLVDLRIHQGGWCYRWNPGDIRHRSSGRERLLSDRNAPLLVHEVSQPVHGLRMKLIDAGLADAQNLADLFESEPLKVIKSDH